MGDDQKGAVWDSAGALPSTSGVSPERAHGAVVAYDHDI